MMKELTIYFHMSVLFKTKSAYLYLLICHPTCKVALILFYTYALRSEWRDVKTLQV